MKNRKTKDTQKYIILVAAAIALALIATLGRIYFRDDEAADFMADGVLRVCLDPGHGGDDPGAKSADGLRSEKDDCLSLALKIRAALADRYPETDVVMTREDDTYLTLEERCDVANRCGADLFVSIHRNSADGSASGVEIWADSKKPKTDRHLAEKILKAVGGVGVASDRGVKYGTASNTDGNYYVNANTDMPSCLIEMGFITSQADNDLLDQNIDAYAAAIAEAVGEMLNAGK